MKAAVCVFGLCLCAAVWADEPYWVEPMKYVHQDFTGSSGSMARFGDSITASWAFFKPLSSGHSNTTPEDDVALSWLQFYIDSTCWSWQDDNPVTYRTQTLRLGAWCGNQGSMTSQWPLNTDQDPPQRNIDFWLDPTRSGVPLLNPEMAVIMFGTNDMHTSINVTTYTNNMREIVQACKANGSIPLLMTIPPRRGYVTKAADFAQAARDLAVEQEIPLLDYHAEIMTRRPGTTWDGTLVSTDGVHPSNTAPTRDFSQTMLSTNGYTLRNWITLHGLYEVYDLVIDAPPPPVNDHVTYTYKYLGNGQYGVTFVVDADDGQQDSYTAQMTFEGVDGGQIQQIAPDLGGGPINVDTQMIAELLDGLGSPPYDKDRDTYVLNPFAENLGSLVEGANSYYVNAHTGVGSAVEAAPLAYVVTTGDVYFSGLVSRLGSHHDVLWTAEMPIPGDANTDEAVDLLDLTIVANNWNQSPRGWGEADFNGDGLVDLLDLTIVANFWDAGGGPVPEPGTLGLLCVAGLGLLVRRRRAG